jgi:glutathione S-transferase
MVINDRLWRSSYTRKVSEIMSQPITLYSLATPNGQKVSIALEEMGLAYEAHTVDIRKGEQHDPEYLKLNPNGKIPTITDPDGPGGEAITIMETGAILIYLADKSGKFLSKDSRERMETLQWLFFQIAHIGPMFGQFGHFYAHEGKDECDNPYPLRRYQNETKRLLAVLEERLKSNAYLAGEEYSIADIATFPWVGCLDWGYHAREAVSLESFPHVMAWHKKCSEREAAKRGAEVCPFE